MKRYLKLMLEWLGMGIWFVFCVFLASTFPWAISAIAVLMLAGFVGIIWMVRKIEWK